jgi:hypothetical protein
VANGVGSGYSGSSQLVEFGKVLFPIWGGLMSGSTGCGSIRVDVWWSGWRRPRMCRGGEKSDSHEFARSLLCQTFTLLDVWRASGP